MAVKKGKMQIMTNMVLMIGTISMPREGKGFDGYVSYAFEMREAIRLSRNVVWSDDDKALQKNYRLFEIYIHSIS